MAFGVARIDSSRVVCMTRTSAHDGLSLVLDEVSAVELQTKSPTAAAVVALDPCSWRLLAISEGSMGGNVCLSVASISAVLAGAGISIMVLSSYSGEYLLFPSETQDAVIAAIDESDLGATLHILPAHTVSGEALAVLAGLDMGAFAAPEAFSDTVSGRSPDRSSPRESLGHAHTLTFDTLTMARIGGIASSSLSVILAPLLDLFLFADARSDRPVLLSIFDVGGEVSILADTESASELEAAVEAAGGDKRARVVLRMWRGSWTPIRVAETLDLVETGVVASLAGPLADAGIHAMFYHSTFFTDYTIVRHDDIATAKTVLSARHHIPE